MENAKEEKRKNVCWFTLKTKWRGIGGRFLTVLLYHRQQHRAPLPGGEGQRDAGKKRGKNQMSEDLPSTNKAPKQQYFLLESARLSIQPPLGFFFFKWHHCSILIVGALFVGASWEGGIKKKIRQFDGCLLISRPLRLWLPNIKPAITDQSSHLHLHTPNSWIGSN